MTLILVEQELAVLASVDQERTILQPERLIRLLDEASDDLPNRPSLQPPGQLQVFLCVGKLLHAHLSMTLIFSCDIVEFTDEILNPLEV